MTALSYFPRRNLQVKIFKQPSRWNIFLKAAEIALSDFIIIC